MARLAGVGLLHSTIDLDVLETNYRMGIRLACFVSIESYNFLGCSLTSVNLGPLYQALEELFVEFAPLEWVRGARQPPAPIVDRQFPGLWNMQRLAFDLDNAYSSTVPGSHSLANFANIHFLAELVQSLLSTGKIKTTDIGIGTPYREQKGLIGKMLRFVLPDGTHLEIAHGTLDQFQGAEFPIWILDLVTGDKNNPANLKFLLNWLRMNVGLSRGRIVVYIILNWRKLWAQLEILGHSAVGKQWADFLVDLRDMGDIVLIPAGYYECKFPPSKEAYLDGDTDNWILQPESNPEDSVIKSTKLLRGQAKAGDFANNPSARFIDNTSNNLNVKRRDYLKRYHDDIKAQRADQQLAHRRVADLEASLMEALAKRREQTRLALEVEQRCVAAE